MKQFKNEYKNCVVTINAQGVGRLSVDTSSSDPETWANVPEFQFMIEDVKEATHTPKKVVEEKAKTVDYNDYTYTQLKGMFPDVDTKVIKSKKAFIEHLTK